MYAALFHLHARPPRAHTRENDNVRGLTNNPRMVVCDQATATNNHECQSAPPSSPPPRTLSYTRVLPPFLSWIQQTGSMSLSSHQILRASSPQHLPIVYRPTNIHSSRHASHDNSKGFAYPMDRGFMRSWIHEIDGSMDRRSAEFCENFDEKFEKFSRKSSEGSGILRIFDKGEEVFVEVTGLFSIFRWVRNFTVFCGFSVGFKVFGND